MKHNKPEPGNHQSSNSSTHPQEAKSTDKKNKKNNKKAKKDLSEESEQFIPDEIIEINFPKIQDDDALDAINSKIQKWIQNNSETLSEYPWTANISPAITVDNPYKCEISIEGTCPAIQLQTEQCHTFEIPNGLIEHRVTNSFPDHTLLFLSEQDSKDAVVDLNKELKSNIIQSYFLQHSDPPSQSQLTLHKAPPIPTTQFITVTLSNISSEFPIIAPMQIVARLMSEKSFISEEWSFYPTSNIELYQKHFPNVSINLNHKAAFELPDMTSQNYFVLLLSNILVVGGSTDINRYYSTGKEGQSMKTLSKTWPRNHEIFTPFAFAFVDLRDMLSNSRIHVKNVYVLDQSPTGSHLRSLIESARSKKIKPRVKINFDFDVAMESVSYVEELTQNDFYAVRLIKNIPQQLSANLHLSHKVQVTIETASFRLPSGVKGRNIFGVVTLRNSPSSEPLELHHSKMHMERSFGGSTKCYYHKEKGVFDETFVFDLPYPVEKSICICIEFYHLIAQETREKTDRQFIGSTYFSLMDNDNLVPDGIHQSNIYYNKLGKYKKDTKKIDTNNCATIDIRFDTSLFYSDAALKDFIASRSINSIQNISKENVVAKFYLILDLLTQTILTNPSDAIIGIITFVDRAISYMRNNTLKYLNIYATNLSMRKINSDYHFNLMYGWTEYMDKNFIGGERKDKYLLEFFFIIILKSLILTNDCTIGNVFSKFAISFSHSTLKESDPFDSLTQYANFLNAFFNAGFYEEATYAISYQVELMLANSSGFLEHFLKEVFKPKLFYFSIMKIQSMRELLLKLVILGKDEIPFIYNLLLDLISLYPNEIQHNIGMALHEFISELSPLHKIDIANEFISEQIFFIFLIENLEYNKKTSVWWKNANKDNVTQSLISISRNIRIPRFSNAPIGEINRLKEMFFAAELSILNFIKFAAKDKESVKYITTLLFRFFFQFQILEVNIYHRYLRELIDIGLKDVIYFLRNIEQAPTTLFKCLLKQTSQSPLISEFFYRLISTDDKLVCPSLYRAISNLKKEELELIKLTKPENVPENEMFSQFIEDIKRLIEIEGQLMKYDLDINTYNLLILKKIGILRHSPDSTNDILSKFAMYQKEKGYFAESVQVRLLQVAIILEHLTVQKKIGQLYGTLHPSSVLEGICTFSEFAHCKFDTIETLLGFCDSPNFGIKSLNSLIYDIIKKSFSTQQYEVSLLLLNIAWPLYESTRAYMTLSRIFKLEKSIIDMSQKSERIFGHFFKVSFFGKCFGDFYDGKTFVYREKTLVHLYEFSDELIQTHQKLCPNTKIELIKEKGEVDKFKLDNDKGYIQITFIEPYFAKKEYVERNCDFYKANFVKCFSFETPFLKDSNKAQGNIDEQWIRRTIVNVKYAMPFITKLQEVVRQDITEFPPIRVSYRQLREKLISLETAVQSRDCQEIQRLLHGTLLAQVNEGPVKIAEVFLSEKNTNDKYQTKMIEIFNDTIDALKRALEIHGKWVAESQPEFKPLQEQLEHEFKAFVEKLTKYI